MLEKVSGIPNYKFNPWCFLCDEGGANYKAVEMVYGEEFYCDHVQGCQFHFKQQVYVPEEHRDEFIKICNELCLITTVTRYEILKGKLEELACSAPSLWTWIDWWHMRRAHIFGPFRHGRLPRCNLSEQGNKNWRPSGIMRLVHAARDDAIMMMFQEMRVSLFEQNLHKTMGRAANQAVRELKDRGKQLWTAQEFFIMRNDPHAILLQAKEAMYPASHIPKSRSSSKPPPNKKPKKFVTKKVPDGKKAKQVRFNKNQKPTEDLMILEEQIELAREAMNKKVKEVEVQKQAEVQKHKIPSIIKNPKDVEYGIPNEVNIPKVQEVKEVQNVQAPQVAQIVQIPQEQQVR